jgi:hypothetical protein
MDARVLPEGVGVEYGPPPAPPADFADGYVLPVHTEKPLQRVHRHPNDDRLVFYEKPHVYTYDGVPTSASVTALAHQHERPFVAHEAIAAMKQSRSQMWPRLDYVVDASPGLEKWTPARGALLVAAGKTVSVVHPHSMAAGSRVEDMLHLHASSNVPTDDVEAYTYERERTDDEIAQGWAAKGRLASHQGTEGHYLCECFFNGVPFRWWEPEMKVLFDFVETHLVPRGIVAWNTEKEIVCPDADLAGSIDLIVYEPATKLHHIIDFKRSDKLKEQLWGYAKMRAPLTHLDDSKGASYALQTSLYQYVLEREYGMTIGERILLSIHPDQPFCTAVPYLKAETEYLMAQRFALVQARRAARDARPDDFTCALTGAPLVDAVRLCGGGDVVEGTLVMEKAAQVRELEYVVDKETRKAFQDAVAQATKAPPALRKADCLPWRQRMPQGGLMPFASRPGGL